MYFENVDELKSYYEQGNMTIPSELLVFLADQSDYLLQSLVKYCNEQNIELVGGIYSGLLVKDELKKEGLVVLEITSIFKTKVLPNMMKSYKDDTNTLLNKVAIVMADGLSPHFKVLVDTIYSKLKDKVTYVGGGAGYYDLKQRSCIFDNKGLYKDVAFVVILDHPAVVSYRHGWERLDGPFLATKTYDNVLCEIDSSPAFDVYRDILYDHLGAYITNEGFFEIAKGHPFGIDLGQGVDIVRDPIAVLEDGTIVCVASIPEESSFYILTGDVNTVLKSSFEVAKACTKNNFNDFHVLLFDCISRAMYLEDAFKKELGNIQMIIEKPVFGALCIGELSSLTNGSLQLHNKSAVLAAIEK